MIKWTPNTALLGVGLILIQCLAYATGFDLELGLCLLEKCSDRAAVRGQKRAPAVGGRSEPEQEASAGRARQIVRRGQ